MKQTKILAIGNPHGSEAACSAEKIKAKLGSELVIVPNEKIMERWKSIDPKAAEAEAESYWLSQAQRVMEPRRDEIVDSANLFLAIKQIMIQGDTMTLLHRVVFYGDHAGSLQTLGDLMGFKVIEEGGLA